MNMILGSTESVISFIGSDQRIADTSEEEGKSREEEEERRKEKRGLGLNGGERVLFLV